MQDAMHGPELKVVDSDKQSLILVLLWPQTFVPETGT